MGYQVRALGAPASHVFALPVSPQELESWRSSGGRADRNFEPEKPAEDPAREIGTKLFRALFAGEIRTALRVAIGRAESGRTRLRLRLHFGAPELAALPWELLYDPDERSFLFWSPNRSLLRTLETTLERRPLAVRGRLRLLLVKSGPRDLSHLDLEREIVAIRAALAKLKWRCWLRIDSVEPDLVKISEHLRKHEYHIMHFLGHGGFRQDSGGELYFEDEGGGSLPVRSDLVGELLKHESLRLVVLNACNGARSCQEDPFSGVAQRLARSGVPAVIAMQSPVEDRTAILFAEKLYTHLVATGRPGQALSLTRQSLGFARHDAGWAIPALYMQAPDGQLFDPERTRKFPPCIRRTLAVAGALFVMLGLGLWRWLATRPEIAPPTPPPPPVERSPDCPSPPDINMVFVKIPAGTFRMGASRGDDDNRPKHDVTITRPYCLGAYEVSQRQYQAITGSDPSHVEGENLPVEKVTWEDAQAFVAKLNESEPAARYRLPTEAEWEYAARGGKVGLYGFGDDEALLPGYGNCLGGKDGYIGTAPVGQFKGNRWDLRDMHGNVSEWVEDRYGLYGSKPVTDPTGPPEGNERVRRGGSFRNTAVNCNAVLRKHSKPDQALYDVGFRVVRDPIPLP